MLDSNKIGVGRLVLASIVLIIMLSYAFSAGTSLGDHQSSHNTTESDNNISVTAVDSGVTQTNTSTAQYETDELNSTENAENTESPTQTPIQSSTSTQEPDSRTSDLEFSAQWIYNNVANYSTADVLYSNVNGTDIVIEYSLNDENYMSNNQVAVVRIIQVLSAIENDVQYDKDYIPSNVTVIVRNSDEYETYSGFVRPEWASLTVNRNISYLTFYYQFRSTYGDVETIGSVGRRLQNETRSDRLNYTERRAREIHDEDYPGLPVRSVEVVNETLRIEYEYDETDNPENFTDTYLLQALAYQKLVTELGITYTPSSGAHVVVYHDGNRYASYRIRNDLVYRGAVRTQLIGTYVNDIERTVERYD